MRDRENEKGIGIEPDRGNARQVVMAVALASLYFSVLAWTSYAKFVTFGYDDFDLAAHTQTLYSITHGSLECSILGIPFLGNHMVLILYAFAPLYWLWSSPLLLLFAQSFALALGGLGIFFLARKELPPPYPLVIAFAYFLHPAVAYMNLYEFHPVALATCFLIYAFVNYKRLRFPAFMFFIALSISCQENIPFIAIGFAGLALVERRRWMWSVVPFVTGTAYLALTVGYVLPRLNPGIINFSALYAHLGDNLGHVAINVLRHPFGSLRSAWSPEKGYFFSALLSPWAYLSLLSPAQLVPVLPVLAQRLLSNRASEASLLYHYQAEFLPFAAVAAVYGVKRLLSFKPELTRRTAWLPLLVMPVICLTASDVPSRLVKHTRAAINPSPFVLHARQTVAQIPSDAAVAATFQFLPYLAERSTLHSMHHVARGFYTLSAVPYPLPKHLDYIVINTLDPLCFGATSTYTAHGSERLRRLIADEPWAVVDNCGPLLVLRNDARATGPPADALVQSLERVPGLNRHVALRGPSPGELIGFTLDPPDSDGVAPLVLYWRTDHGPECDSDALLTLSWDRRQVQTQVALGSRFYPVAVWPHETIVSDRHGISLPNSLPDREECRLVVVVTPSGWVPDLATPSD